MRILTFLNLDLRAIWRSRSTARLMLASTFVCLGVNPSIAEDNDRDSIQAGSVIIVGAEGAELQVEAESVADLKRGEVLQVSLTNGEWLFVWERKGWIHRDDVWTPRTAEAFFDQAIKDKASPILYYNRGIARYTANRIKDAIVDFTIALKFDPENPEIHNSRGIAWRKLGDFNRAIADISKAIEIDDKKPLFWISRSGAWAEQGNAERALEDAEKAVQLAPDSAVALNSRGVCRFEAGDYEAALSDYSTALEIAPQFATAYANRGAVFKRLEKFQAVREDYENAIRFNPHSATALNDFAWFLATCSNEKMRNSAKAVEFAERACELTAHSDWNMLDTLAVAYAENGDQKKAAATVEAALKIAPEETKSELQERLEHYRAN